MRCPKCGYISFDQQTSCGNCATDLGKTAELLQGTGVPTEPDFFLHSILESDQAEEAVDDSPAAGDLNLALEALGAEEIDGISFDMPLGMEEEIPAPAMSEEEVEVVLPVEVQIQAPPEAEATSDASVSLDMESLDEPMPLQQSPADIQPEETFDGLVEAADDAPLDLDDLSSGPLGGDIGDMTTDLDDILSDMLGGGGSPQAGPAPSGADEILDLKLEMEKE